MDSMVNHYTAAKRLRSTDAYTAGNVAGFRPDYAVSVYARIVKQLYPDSMIILGGIEASLRRFTHYDYWADKLLPSILSDTEADLLVYGMGEKPMKEILKIFLQKTNPPISDFYKIPQIVYKVHPSNAIDEDFIRLHSHADCLRSKAKFAQNFKWIERESNKMSSSVIVQETNDQLIIANPPVECLSETALDETYELPYTRLPHPKYRKRGQISAFEMINTSVNIHRGCFGGCSFCTISAHQGKFITSRSEESVLDEIQKITRMPYFKGYISDLGAPSANMYRMKGKDTSVCRSCGRASCLFPKICPNLDFNHKPLVRLYQKAAQIPSVKKITIGSGIRYDMLLSDDPKIIKAYGLKEYTETVIRNHVSGRLKVAPEHTEKHVLYMMRKPAFDTFIRFKAQFDRINHQYSLNQQLIPYFISSHPACTTQDMKNLTQKVTALACTIEQVQDFTPTPMTLASTIFYSGIDPYTGKKVFCQTNLQEKKKQHQCFFPTKR
jgi:uncharacterized radical SAM protein YgiQ